MLRFHGDSELGPGLVDLAVNVRPDPMPGWLARPVRDALSDLARYPDAGPARAAVAARHGRPLPEVLLTAGAAQAFSLLATALRPAHAVVVHPQFTEPESALPRAASYSIRARCGLRAQSISSLYAGCPPRSPFAAAADPC